MKLHISEKAAAWYKNELGLCEGDCVRFYARYGGFSSFQPGFSLGVSTEPPVTPGVETVVDGIVFYVEASDLWYFDNNDFYIDLDPTFEEPEFKIAN